MSSGDDLYRGVPILCVVRPSLALCRDDVMVDRVGGARHDPYQILALFDILSDALRN